jgi:hypothetical protein
MALKYAKPELIALKGHPEYTEKWLQDIIAEDPSVLGLGDVELIERERRQEKAGRLDLMMYDRDENCRYEVELMLGPTDESHIIRCIEYWDIERRRYPGYDHCAVIVAEDITGRFLNVLSLFAGSIPLIAIQLSALKIGEQIVLNFVQVLDRGIMRKDDTSESADTAPTDRNYWNTRSTPQVLEMIDTMLEIINQRAKPAQKLTFNKFYIGLSDGTRPRNFIYFSPRKQFMYMNVKVASPQIFLSNAKQANLDAGIEGGHIWITLTPRDVEPHRKLLTEVIHAAVDEFQKD